VKPVMIKVELIDHDKTGLQVRKKRRQLGLTLAEVADRTELSVSYLSGLERGDRGWTFELFDKVWGALR
jgi:transcriptional regulator with XRE-family HTH domain